jgi:hypothetical protein
VKITAYWDVTPCGLIQIYGRFVGKCYRYFQVRKIFLEGYSKFLPNDPEDGYSTLLQKARIMTSNGLMSRSRRKYC